MEFTGYRQRVKYSEFEIKNLLDLPSINKDELSLILRTLEMVIHEYNEFTKTRNKDYKENNGLSKVEYPCINLYIKRMNVDSEDKNIINDKSIIVDLNVMYPDGTKSKELDTYELCGEE